MMDLLIQASALDNIWSILGKPDNLPIVFLLISVPGLTFYSLYIGVKNDKFKEEAGDENVDILYPPEEEEFPKRLFTWPSLLKVEFLCALLVMVALTVWSICLDAPLEEPAEPSQTPNPSKAPWYFLGLQELLVYFDPWMAGVALPGMILVGLMIIPYVDFNPKGNGYFTWKERKFAIGTFLFGLYFWVVLITIGTLLRGPGWILFWPWQKWDADAVMLENNIDLSEIFGFSAESTMGMVIGAGFLAAFIGGTMGATHLYMTKRHPALLERMGLIRFGIVAHLFWIMVGVFLKFVIRNGGSFFGYSLKYIFKWPEFFMNV